MEKISNLFIGGGVSYSFEQIWDFWLKPIFIREIKAKHFFGLKTTAKLFFLLLEKTQLIIYSGGGLLIHSSKYEFWLKPMFLLEIKAKHFFCLKPRLSYLLHFWRKTLINLFIGEGGGFLFIPANMRCFVEANLYLRNQG